MSNGSNGGGIGFCGLLTVLFVGLKLTGYIGWSWFWVLSPIILPAIFIACVLSAIFIAEALGEL